MKLSVEYCYWCGRFTSCIQNEVRCFLYQLSIAIGAVDSQAASKTRLDVFVVAVIAV